MPSLGTIEGYHFFFFSNEGGEPAHVHAEKGERQAKFWLDPVSLAVSYGFRRNELTELHRIVEEKKGAFLKRWHEHIRP